MSQSEIVTYFRTRLFQFWGYFIWICLSGKGRERSAEILRNYNEYELEILNEGSIWIYRRF